MLHYLVVLPVEEVDLTLGMPNGTVKSLLSRGRHALAAKLGETEEVLEFFKSIYYWTESLACIQRLPTRFSTESSSLTH